MAPGQLDDPAVPLLSPAALPATMVHRPRLYELLDRGTTGPATLLSAPAGWGKSTLLAAWYRARGPATGGDPVIWLSVEPAGVAGVGGVFGASGLSGAGGDTASAPRSVVERLAGDIARAPGPVTVILDDLDRISDPEVPANLETLLRRADGRLRLVIAARRDPDLPWHRWRLTDELTEIRAADLAFTAEEIADLLAAHGVNLPADGVRQLRARTEGWPAGVRFAAFALRDHPEPDRLAAVWGGDQPTVADYLTREVLAELDDESRSVLCVASLVDPAPGGLIDALTGRVDGDRLLADASRRTGFVSGLGTRPEIYRCHPLLGDLLRAELDRRPAAALRDLHRRAAGWFAAAGAGDDALRHAVAAADWDRAAWVFTEHWADLLPYGPAGPSRPPTFPPPLDVVRQVPEVALAYAVDRLDAGDLRDAAQHLDFATEAGDRLDSARRDRLTGMVAVLRLLLAERTDPTGGSGRWAKLRHLSHPVTARLLVADCPATRAATRLVLGSARFAAGAFRAAEAELGTALADARQAGLPRAARICAARLALVLAVRGRLRAAERTSRLALGMDPVPAGGPDGSPVPVASGSAGPAPDIGPRPSRDRPPVGDRRRTETATALLAQAIIALQQDRHREAGAKLGLAAPPPGTIGEPVVEALAAMVRSLLLRDRNDLGGAYRALGAAREALAAGPPAGPLRYSLLAAEADLHTARGDFAAARDLLLPELHKQVPSVEPVAVALARAWLRDGDPVSAGRVLPDWTGSAAQAWSLPVRLTAGLLDACVAKATGDERGAARRLERVLELAEPERVRRVFSHADPPVRDLLSAHLDSGTAFWPTVSELLLALDATAARPPASSELGEPLTERELTVLRYLQSILSNVEIAAELSLSVNTIKTHVRNIYRKLDATRRREAVRRARELKLL